MELFSKLFIYDILIHIVFLYTILYLFFFLVGLKEERDSMESIFKMLSRYIISYARENDPENYKKIDEVKDKYKLVETKLLEKKIKEMSKKTKDTNKKYIEISTFILIMLFFILTITTLVYIFLFNFSGITLLKIVRNNLLLFLGICMIEVLFFFIVILKYVPLQNREFKKIFVKSYNKNIEEK